MYHVFTLHLGSEDLGTIFSLSNNGNVKWGLTVNVEIKMKFKSIIETTGEALPNR